MAGAVDGDFTAKGQRAAEMDRVIIVKGDHATRTDRVNRLPQGTGATVVGIGHGCTNTSIIGQHKGDRVG